MRFDAFLSRPARKRRYTLSSRLTSTRTLSCRATNWSRDIFGHFMPKLFWQQTRVPFRCLFLLSEIGNFAPEEYEQYLLSMGEISDYYNTIDTAAEEAEKRGHARGLKEGREEGREEGLKEGREEGREEGQRQAIMTMLASGISVTEIAKAFSMTEDECRELMV